MSWLNIVLLAKALLLPLAITSLIGGVLLPLCLSIMGVPRPSWRQSCKIYLAAASYGLIVLLVLGCLVTPGQLSFWEALVSQALVACITQLVVILLWLRKFSVRAVVAQVVCVLVTNLVTFMVLTPAITG